MIHCNDALDRHRKEIGKLHDYFDKKTNLTKAYGNMDNSWVREQLSTLFLDSNHVPLSENLPPTNKNGKLNMSVYAEARNAIDKWDKSLKGQVNSFEALVRTPSAIYRKNPVTIAFNNKISSILNTERKNKSVYLRNLKDIANDVKYLMSAANGGDGKYSKVSKRLDSVYKNISEAVSKKDVEGASKYMNELGEIMSSNDSQQVLTKLVDLVENHNMSDLNKLIKTKDDMQMNLVRTAKEIKGFLSKMGDVNIKGLEKMKDVVDGYFKGSHNNKVKRIKNNIDTAIKRMKEAKEEGMYFPHYSVENLLQIETVVDNVNPFKIFQDESYADQVLADIENGINSLPTNVLASRRNKRQLFVQDPIRVLESYAQNASMFNKKQFLMDAYLGAIKDLSPSKADFDGLAQISEYMAHKYTATMQGYKDANQSVKTVSSAIAKLQTMSKMGLSVTGAIRNSTQQFWYANYVGYRKYRRGRKLLKSSETYTYGFDEKGNAVEKDIKSIIENVSSEEGYFFDSASMETISKGGITELEGISSKNIKFDVDDNGNPFIEYKKDGTWKRIDKALGKYTGKSLMFHQWTENIVRGDVYKNAFSNHFDMLFRNEPYKQREARRISQEQGISVDKAMDKVHKSIERQSHNMALNWVRMTQFEYTTPDRPNLFGGGTTNASVIGNSVFQFFPYAAHMFEMNARVMSEGMKSLFRGDINSWKFGAMARMIGFQTFGVGLASIVLNNEFRYLIENDTFSRLKNLYDLFTAEDMSEADFGNGLVQQLSGPMVADMLFWMEAAGVTDFGDGDIQQLIMGYYDIANQTESDRDRMMANRASVQWAKILKSRESFINGDITGIIRNNFLMYPSDFTRKGHETLMDMIGLETASQKRKKADTVPDFVSTLPDDQRQKILGIIQDLKKDTEVDRSIPTGLQNLTIR